MKQLITEISEQFYDHITKSQYFASFFIDKEMDEIREKLKVFMYNQLTSEPNEGIYKSAYNVGVIHAEQGIPLNNIINFADLIQTKIFKYIDENRDSCKDIKIENIENMKNWFAKGYLHETVRRTDMMSIPLFSVLSTTRISTSIISLILDITKTIMNEKESNSEHVYNHSCDLMSYLNKPFFNMIFDSEENFFEFNKMHVELHNIANSLLYFLEEKSYSQAYFVYNDFIDECKNFLNFYFERVVLFEQNNQNYFYEYIQKKIDNGRNVTIFTFNIRNMQMINKIWGLETGDFIVNEIERLIDKKHGMNSDKSVFIKTQNAEFIIAMLNEPNEKTIEEFNNVNNTIERFLINQEESIADVKISSSLIPFANQAVHNRKHLRQIVQQAITLSKNNEHLPLICNNNVLSQLNKNVLYDENVRHFIKKSFNSDNFKPYYHKIVNTVTGEVSHVEALARVCDKDSCISASNFIDYLVETGRVVELDKVMLVKILNEFSTLRKFVSTVFINISPKSLRAASYVKCLRDFIHKADSIGMKYVFEITEQSLFDNIDLIRSLHKVHGSVFAIDDFGSGYSNFSIVSDLGQEGLIKYLKIDGSLIKDIHSNIYKENIVAGIIHIASTLNMQTVAEFVADEETSIKLKKLRSTYMQGFYFALPQPIESFTEE